MMGGSVSKNKMKRDGRRHQRLICGLYSGFHICGSPTVHLDTHVYTQTYTPHTHRFIYTERL